MSAGKKKLPTLNINTQASSVDGDSDELRNIAGLNSPVAMGHAGDVDAIDDIGNESPSENTRRTKYDLNSPKAGPDPSSFMTQVERPDTANKQTTTQTERPRKSGGWCSCFSPAQDIDEETVAGRNTELASKDMSSQAGSAPVVAQAGATTQTAGSTYIETAEDIANEEAGLLGRRLPKHRNQKTLVIDLDETLVHSSFKKVSRHDFIVPVEIENVVHNVYVLVRPGAVEFLEEAAKQYEIVLFTASLSKYADPLLDLLDRSHTIDYRLFRESCVQIGYTYVKDLTRLGRRMEDLLIIDNSPQSYRFQPCNAIPCTSWFDDPHDTELYDLLPVLTTTLVNIPDVRDLLDASKSYAWLCAQATQE